MQFPLVTGFIVMTLFAGLWQEGRGQPLAAPPAKERQVRVLVAYSSRTGNTEHMAQGVAEGAKRIANAVVTLKKIEDVTRDDLQLANAIILGCPTYFANIPGKVKVVLDEWAWKWRLDLTDKIGAAFATGGGQAGGKEHVVTSLLLYMLSNRMVVAGPLYEDTRDSAGIWGEPGSAAMTGPLDLGVSEKELDSAKRLGERVARLASKLSEDGRAIGSTRKASRAPNHP